MCWKYGGTRQATDDDTAHAHCMLDNRGCKHTPAICNAYCFSTATMVARTRLIVKLYVHFVSCFHQLQPDDIHMIVWQTANFYEDCQEVYLLYHRYCQVRLSHLKMNVTIEGQLAHMKGLDGHITLPRQYKSPTETRFPICKIDSIVNWSQVTFHHLRFSQ